MRLLIVPDGALHYVPFAALPVQKSRPLIADHEVAYLQAATLLNTLRRRTGLPHKILLDEAHYYLGGPEGARLIDPEFAGYILVTYRVSGLDPSIRMTSDAVVMGPVVSAKQRG